jgi:ferritin-like protein
MAKETKIGSNRTGIQMSPKNSKEMIEAAKSAMPTSEGDHMSLAMLRSDYIADAEPVGTIPPPVTLKGALTSGIDMMTGDRPQALLDKLGERAAFERGGTRLYDGVLSKFDADPHAHGSVSRDVLQHFRNEEAKHFQLVCEAVEQLGGDPTAMTPCADLVGVQSMGLWQSVSDPRTTLAQCLNTMLVAELADNAGWELLIELAESSGHDDLAQRFQSALTEEQEHLTQVRAWVKELTRAEASIVPAS